MKSLNVLITRTVNNSKNSKKIEKKTVLMEPKQRQQRENGIMCGCSRTQNLLMMLYVVVQFKVFQITLLPFERIVVDEANETFHSSSQLALIPYPSFSLTRCDGFSLFLRRSPRFQLKFTGRRCAKFFSLVSTLDKFSTSCSLKFHAF